MNDCYNKNSSGYNISRGWGWESESGTDINAMLDSFKAISEVKVSPREMQTIGLWLCGQSAKESSRVLGISNRTVETYRVNIKEKLGVYSKTELFNLLNKHGLRVSLTSLGLMCIESSNTVNIALSYKEPEAKQKYAKAY